MRLGLIADVHGNLLALDAVLADLEGDGVDALLCLGDVAVGPQPSEAVARVHALACPVVMGNWDAWFLDGFPELEGDVGRKLVEMGTWWAGRLSDGDRDFMRNFEPMVEVELGSGLMLLAFHGSPRSYDDFIFATTPDEQLERMLGEARAPVLAGGHTHFQLVRRHGDAVLVNPGSVGLPFYRREPVMRIAPWAEYGIVTVEDGRLSVELRRTAFDADELVRLIVASGMPHAEWWASLWTRPGTGAPMPPAA